MELHTPAFNTLLAWQACAIAIQCLSMHGCVIYIPCFSSPPSTMLNRDTQGAPWQYSSDIQTRAPEISFAVGTQLPTHWVVNPVYVRGFASDTTAIACWVGKRRYKTCRFTDRVPPTRPEEVSGGTQRPHTNTAAIEALAYKAGSS